MIINDKNLIEYEKIDYVKYQKRIQEILSSEAVRKCGVRHEVLGFSEYQYPIELIKIGSGKKDLFIVAGTHGCEIITVDFVTQLMKNITSLTEFDPNEVTINIVPIQNPEGFDISTNSLGDIDDADFEKRSLEYYYRYRTDAVIASAIRNLNLEMNALMNRGVAITPEILLNTIKEFFQTQSFKEDPNIINTPKAIPGFKDLFREVEKITDVTTFADLKIKLLATFNRVQAKLNKCSVSDSDTLMREYFLYTLIDILKQGISEKTIWENINQVNLKKLHQDMFTEKPNSLYSKELQEDLDSLYEGIPGGTYVTHDSTGVGINLNQNTPDNRGINLIKEGTVTYAAGARNNVRTYFKGPIGLPTKDVDSFEFAVENRILYNLLADSYNSGRYLSTLLYHGTGGMIFYKPNQDEMEEDKYLEFASYNDALQTVYNEELGYKLQPETSGGFGDHLRKIFPGVLLVELSTMGGNPIAPYGNIKRDFLTSLDGDIINPAKSNDSYVNTINGNIEAVNRVIGYLIKKNNIKTK